MKGQNSQSSAYNGKSDTISLSKDNDAANKVSQRKRNGMIKDFRIVHNH